jgi:hypothetical protein
VPLVGSLEATWDPFQPYRLLDVAGAPVPAAGAYFAELAACGRPATTQRSYGIDLLRWFRFLAALDVTWDQATRAEGRDFCRWLSAAPKQPRPHWRRQDSAPLVARGQPAPNRRTGKRAPGPHYAPATVAHAESVLRAFYDFHLEEGTGPMVNPFPLARGARRGRVDAHHNPLEPFARTRRGRYRPKLSTRLPRMIPDDALRRALRRAFFAPRPGAGRLLRIERCPRLGAARRDGRRRRPRPAAHHRCPQGHARPAAGASVARRFRVAALVPSRARRRGARRTRPAAVVDAAPSAPPARLRRLPSDVQPGERRARGELVAPRPSPHGRLPDGSEQYCI